MGRVFANGSADLGSIPGRVIPKTLKMVLDTSLLNTQRYKVRIEGKVEQSKERSSPLPSPRWSSYWKGSLLVALDYDRQLTLFLETMTHMGLFLFLDLVIHAGYVQLIIWSRDVLTQQTGDTRGLCTTDHTKSGCIDSTDVICEGLQSKHIRWWSTKRNSECYPLQMTFLFPHSQYRYHSPPGIASSFPVQRE